MNNINSVTNTECLWFAVAYLLQDLWLASNQLQHCIGPCNACEKSSVCSDVQTLLLITWEHCCHPQLYQHHHIWIHILDPLHYAKRNFVSRTKPKIEDYTSSLWKTQFYVHRLLPATGCTALSKSSEYTPNITTKAHIILLCGRQVVLVNQQFQHLLVSFHCSVMHCRSSTLKQ